jgi:hypothetical protein
MLWERFFTEITDEIKEKGVTIDIETGCEIGCDVIEIESGMTVSFIIE